VEHFYFTLSMLFLDVTSSCKSAKSTGMQRTTRKIFTELRKQHAVNPICWNLGGDCYHLLGSRELEILRNPFRVLSRATARPEWHGETFLAELYRLVFRKGIRLEDELKEGDLLLVPDLFRDGRMDRLPKVIAQTAARSIAIFHDAAALRLGGISPGSRARFQHYIESLAAFDLVICVSQESCDHLHRLWLDRGTAATATCVERWPVEWDRPARHAIGNPSRNLIVCVGTLESRKNYATLLRALESLWEEGLTFEFELIGRSTGSYGHKILPSIRKIQKRGWPFRWLKHVDDERLERAYRDCAFTVYPSLMEGFGLPILESLSHGKPCICGDNGALGEASAAGGCLNVDQTSSRALADAIKQLLTDQALCARFSAEARARRFRSWSNYIDCFCEHMDAISNEESVAPEPAEAMKLAN
jgi:glycosyltransferase involved in cell wall biosynthesis